MDVAKGIDIIIPVYNAFEDLQQCTASVFACTNFTHNRLILINDASSDARIQPLLQTLGQFHEHVITVENEKNLGFSGSINRGLDISENRDVILLNSDTIVTKNWVEKMYACAYSDISIATVTPLSNNATLCSTPEFFKENTIPENYTLEDYAELIERISLHSYPKIPVANGFCMFIKREVIEKIGNFDAETFGRGYGEENDFCHRAEQFGYHHVMCDDTYIFHSGTGSFLSQEKKRYIARNEQILQERYPAQVQKLQEFLKTMPHRIINENVRFWQTINSNKKNILFVLQADFRNDSDDNIGGVQLHVRDLTEELRKEFNIIVAARNSDYLNVTWYSGEESVFCQYYIGPNPVYQEFRNQHIGFVFGNLLDAFKVDLVHVHHSKGLSLDVFYQAYERQIPVAVTLHDYYYICPSIKLLNINENVCMDPQSRCLCADCLKSMQQVTDGNRYIKQWQENHMAVLDKTAKIFIPSEAAKEIVCRHFPDLEEKMRVIEHGLHISLQSKCSNGTLPEKCLQFNIAFVGGLSHEKGGDLAYRLVKDSPADINWYVFGMMGHTNLRLLKKKNLIKTGTYKREELPSLLEKYSINLVCILSLWPETYCYTLSEVLQYGIPVIATNVGALTERINETQAGWLVSRDNALEETLKLLQYLRQNPSEYRCRFEKAQTLQIKSTSQMGEEYAREYSHILQTEHIPTWKSPDMEYILQGYCFANGMGALSSNDKNVYARLNAAESELYYIHHSLPYKLGKALCEVRIPFKHQLKSIAFKIYKHST